MKQTRLLCAALVACFLMAGLQVHAKGSAKGQLTGVVNVNEASVAQLTMLPGIGQKRAEAIREYAQAHPFKSVDELKSIKGIGDSGLEKLKPFVTVSQPSTAQLVKQGVKQAPTEVAKGVQ